MKCPPSKKKTYLNCIFATALPFFFYGMLLIPSGLWPCNSHAKPELKSSGLPLPRFASLRASPINVRTGPGRRYPIEFVFMWKNMPVEIVAEYDTWRKIRDAEGNSGWVHQNLLTGRRKVQLTTSDTHLLARPDLKAIPLALVQTNAIGDLRKCEKGFCRIKFRGPIEGWLPRKDLFGLLENEIYR